MLNSVNKKAGLVQELSRPAIEVCAALGSFPANYSRKPLQSKPPLRKAGYVPDAMRNGLNLDALKLAHGYRPPSTRVSPILKQFGLSIFYDRGNVRNLINPDGLGLHSRDTDTRRKVP